MWILIGEGLVDVTLPVAAVIPAPEHPVGLVDAVTGQAVPQELVDDAGTRRLAFYAADVPGMGYRSYRMEADDGWPATPAAKSS